MKDWKHLEVIKIISKFYQDKIEVEVPYQHYSMSGFIDVVAEGYSEKEYIEVKTSIMDVGETIRQYQKMRRYLILKGVRKKKIIMVVPLVEELYDIILENWSLFKSVDHLQFLQIHQEYQDNWFQTAFSSLRAGLTFDQYLKFFNCGYFIFDDKSQKMIAQKNQR